MSAAAERAFSAPDRPVALVGLMGVGKTSVGRRLAAHWGAPFVDADAEVEAAAGRSVSDIFAELGEPAFRDGERRVIARLLDGGPQVLATGGGAFAQADTRAILLERALVVWLRADPAVLARRCARRDTRPLLRGRDPLEALTEMAAQRHPLYAMAHVTVETGDGPHQAVVEAVCAAVRAHGAAAR
ncbi:MAG: shikimate kinase [Caulobacteraceae bacterium]|nr:shikimate kinase [Caulobacter sp.]